MFSVGEKDREKGVTENRIAGYTGALFAFLILIVASRKKKKIFLISRRLEPQSIIWN